MNACVLRTRYACSLCPYFTYALPESKHNSTNRLPKGKLLQNKWTQRLTRQDTYKYFTTEAFVRTKSLGCCGTSEAERKGAHSQRSGKRPTQLRKSTTARNNTHTPAPAPNSRRQREDRNILKSPLPFPLAIELLVLILSLIHI